MSFVVNASAGNKSGYTASTYRLQDTIKIPRPLAYIPPSPQVSCTFDLSTIDVVVVSFVGF